MRFSFVSQVADKNNVAATSWGAIAVSIASAHAGLSIANHDLDRSTSRAHATKQHVHSMSAASTVKPEGLRCTTRQNHTVSWVRLPQCVDELISEQPTPARGKRTPTAANAGRPSPQKRGRRGASHVRMRGGGRCRCCSESDRGPSMELDGARCTQACTRARRATPAALRVHQGSIVHAVDAATVGMLLLIRLTRRWVGLESADTTGLDRFARMCCTQARLRPLCILTPVPVQSLGLQTRVLLLEDGPQLLLRGHVQARRQTAEVEAEERAGMHLMASLDRLEALSQVCPLFDAVDIRQLDRDEAIRRDQQGRRRAHRAAGPGEPPPRAAVEILPQFEDDVRIAAVAQVKQSHAFFVARKVGCSMSEVATAGGAEDRPLVGRVRTSGRRGKMRRRGVRSIVGGACRSLYDDDRWA